MRLFGHQPVAIDESAVIGFFDARARRADDASRPGVTMLQDQDQKLALQRSDTETRALQVLLESLREPCPRTLDLGCGAGRLYFALQPLLGPYLGLDGAPTLIEAASRRAHGAALDGTGTGASAPEFRVHDLSCGGLPRSAQPWQLVLMSGILIYLNDASVATLLAELASLLDEPCTVVLREPVGVAERLTLKDHWSDELGSAYNAIYRTRAELEAAVQGSFGARVAGVESRWLYDDPALNNRRETRQALMVVTLR